MEGEGRKNPDTFILQFLTSFLPPTLQPALLRSLAHLHRLVHLLCLLLAVCGDEEMFGEEEAMAAVRTQLRPS